MADTQNDLWISIVAESDMPEDDAPLNLAAAKDLVRAHNESDAAHADIRAQLQTIADKQIEEIKEYATKRDFPASGDTSVTIYIDTSTGNLYRYNTASKKYESLAMDTIPDSISLEGRPTAPTAALGTNSTQVATTAFVQNELATLREQSESVTPVYYDGRTKAKLSLLGENGTIVTNIANGKVEQGSSDAVTGDQLWTAQQDMTNMSALAARNIAANAAEIELLKRAQNPWENLTDENKDTLAGLIEIEGANGVSVTNQATENHVKKFTVSLEAPTGTISEGETNPVSGGVIYTAIQDAVSDINTALENKVSKEDLENAALDNQVRIINGDHTAAMLGEADGKPVYAINVRANGLVQRNDGRLVTGGVVYAETRLEEDGKVISSNNTAAQNIQALDNALFNMQHSIEGLSDAIALTKAIDNLGNDLTNLHTEVGEQQTAIEEISNTKANTDLSNLTETGTNVIRQMINNNAYRIINGDHTTATLGEEDGKTTYAINVRANGAIVDRDGRIVTGQTVYNEVRPNDGTYIAMDYTTGTNLKNLDVQVKKNADNIVALQSTVEEHNSAIEQQAQEVETLASRVEEAEASVTNKVDANTVYDKTEADEKFTEKATTLAGYGIADAYTKSEVDAVIEEKADKATTLSGYGITNAYTKEETDQALSVKANASEIYTKAETDEKIEEAEQNINDLTASYNELASQVDALAEAVPDTAFSAGEYIRISDSNVISVKVSGNVQEGSVGIVTGDKIARAITNSEVRTGNVIQHVHDELTHRIESLEDANSEYAYTLIKDDETNQLILLNGNEVASRIQLATDTGTRYSLEKVGNVIRLVPNDDPSQAIPIELDPDVNTTYTLALENNRLIFTPSDDSDPTVIDLPDAVTHSELVNYVQTSDLVSYVQVSDLEDYAKKEDLDGYVTDEDLADILDENDEALEELKNAVNTKVESNVVSENGSESQLFNSENGAGIRYNDPEQKTESLVNVGNDIQLSITDENSDSETSVIINQDGAYYTTSGTFGPEDEIVVKRDLESYDERIAAIENATVEGVTYTAGNGIIISDENIISVDGSYNDRLTQVETYGNRIEAVEAYGDRIEAVEAFGPRIEAVEAFDSRIEAVEAFEDRIEAVEALEPRIEAVEALEDRIEQLETAEDEFATKAELVPYDERITAVEDSIEELEPRIAELEAKEDKDTVYIAGDGIEISEDNIISVDNRTIYKITSENGNESLIFNEADGGGARYTNLTRNSDSFIGVSDGSNNVDVQIYATDRSSNMGSRININQSGAYYTVSNSAMFTDGDEIATRKDIKEAANVNVYESIESFPEEGTDGRLYIDAETNIPYRWDSELKDYIPVSGNSNIDSLTDEEIDSLF